MYEKKRSLSYYLTFWCPYLFLYHTHFYVLCWIYAFFNSIFIYDFVNQQLCDRRQSHLANYTCLISCIIITTAVLYIRWRHVNYCSSSHLGKNKRLSFSYLKYPFHLHIHLLKYIVHLTQTVALRFLKLKVEFHSTSITKTWTKSKEKRT